jgi:hypothetical protein
MDRLHEPWANERPRIAPAGAFNRVPSGIGDQSRSTGLSKRSLGLMT